MPDDPALSADTVAVAGPVRIIGRDEAERWIDARRSVVGYETWDNQLVHTVAYLWRLINGRDDDSHLCDGPSCDHPHHDEARAHNDGRADPQDTVSSGSGDGAL